MIRVLSSPFSEDTDLPWLYDEDNFIAWVDEVFCEGYKRNNPELSLDDALGIVEGAGYTVEVISV